MAGGAGADGANKAGIASCKNGGWATQGFANRAECTNFYARGGTTSTSTSSTSSSTSTSTSTTSTIPQGPTPAIALAFVDTDAVLATMPSPWAGDPNVVFVGCHRFDAACGDDYVTGAISITNTATGTAPLTLATATVDVGPCHYEPWVALLPATADSGETMILTQSGVFGPPAPAPCNAGFPSDWWPYLNFLTNAGPFDTTQPSFYNCDRTLVPPAVITLTFSNGMTLTITDSNEILTTGGVNERACIGENRQRPWTPVPEADVVRTG